MSLIRHGLLASVCLLASSWTAAAQTNLFLLPNSSSPTGTITGFRLDPFSTITSFAAQPGASFFFVNAAGTKYYSVARSGSDTLLVLDAANPTNVLKRENLSQAEAAVMTPDRRRLLIVANGLHIIDTTTDNVLNTVTDVGNQPTDVAVALDASRAFVLSPTSNRLTAVDLTTNAAVGTPLTIPGASTGVAVGYNGFVYVTTANRLYEIDGRLMTIRSEIPLNARPGKISFTPDGRYGLMVNQTPVTGSSVILIDLLNRTVAGTIPNFQVTLDTLVVASNNRIYAVSNQRQALYEISVSPLNINTPEFGNIGTVNNVTAVTSTNEWPNPRFLFTATTGSLIRLDNSNFPPQGAGAAAILPNQGNLVFAAPAFTGVPTQITGYNNNQTTAVGTGYQPLVVRVFNSVGQPLQGVTVTFSSDNAAAQIQGATVTTNTDGYALTTVVAPPTAGTFSVTASAGGGAGSPSYLFTLTTGNNTGGGTTTGSLTIFRGQGQLVQEQFQIREPLVVQLRDAQGKPAVNQTITFSLQTGSGTFNTSTSDGTALTGAICTANVCTVQTDADGRAGIGFIATAVNPGSSYAQQTITATNGSSSVNFILTTVLGQLIGGGSASPPIVERIKPIERIITGQAGTVLTEAIQVRVIVVSGPQSGQVIPNVSLRASTGNAPETGPTATCQGEGGVALTDSSSGVATCNMALGGRLGQAPLEVLIGGSIFLGGSSLIVDVRPGPPSTARLVQGNNQAGLPGERLRLAFVAEISDSFGNLLPNITGNWAVGVPNSLTLANVVSTSDSSGRVSALGTLGTVAGTNIVRFQSGNVTAAFNYTVNISITGLRTVSGDAQTTTTGQAFPQPLVVQVTDDRGQPATNQVVSFAVASGSASLSAASATTNAAGQASVNVTAGGQPGAITIRASLASLTQTFTLTSRLPGPIFGVNNVVNTASNQPGLVPCGITTIFGTGIAPGLSGVVPANLLGFGGLPLILNGVEVVLDGQTAPVFAVANQAQQESVIFQAPCNLTPGNRISLTVRVSGGTTTTNGIPVLRAQPGIFETNPGGGGRRYAAVQRPNGSWVNPQNPAVRGEILRVLVTGLGAVTPATDTNRTGIPGQAVQAPLILGVNDQGVRVVSAEYAVGMMGVYVVSFELPLDASPGTFRNLAVAAEGLSGDLVFSNGSAIAAIQ